MEVQITAHITYRAASTERAFALRDQLIAWGYVVSCATGSEDRVHINGAVYTFENASLRWPRRAPVKPRPSYKVKRLTDTAIVPTRGSAEAAGIDLHYDGETITLYSGQRALLSTGIALQAPEGCYARVAPRSGLAVKHGVQVLAGVVDRDYTGEVAVVLQVGLTDGFVIKRGDRIAQVIFEHCVLADPVEVDDLEATDRGAGGFGSTGS